VVGSAARWAACILLVGCVALTGCAGQPPSAGSSDGASEGSGSLLDTVRATLLQKAVEGACVRAATAVDDRQRAAWRVAFAAEDEEVRDDLDEVFEHLTQLRVSGTTVRAEQVPGRPGVYDVTVSGRLGDGGPPDRLLAERVLEFGARVGADGAEVRVTADDTPEAVRSQYVMAFHQPRLLRESGVVVVYERAWRERAGRLAGPAAQARDRVLALYGADGVAATSEGGGRQLTLFVYGSADHVRRAFAAVPDQIDARIQFFSHPPVLAGDEPASPTDIGVVAPALSGDGAATALMLEHEVGHAYTMEWFFGTTHSPDFFLEGLAVAAEGTHVWWPLRSALAAGDLEPPLADAVALGDIWSGRETDDVRLLYDAAGSLVMYLLDGWGVETMRAWMQGVADSDLSEESLAAEATKHLGVDWSELRAGWRAYVEQLP